MSTPTIPADLDSDGMTEAERRQYETRQAMRAEALLIQMVPADIPLAELTIRDGAIEVRPVQDGTDDEQRHLLRRLVRILPGFEFAERPQTASTNRVAAVGEVGGVRVEAWNALRPCHCKCHGGL